jgi:hypothetical protein
VLFLPDRMIVASAIRFAFSSHYIFPVPQGEGVMAQSEPKARDGFQVTNKVFTRPSNTASLDPITKRKITICNLFTNHQLPIADIVRVLDEQYKHVVNVLIEQGLIYDRRRVSREVAAEPGRSMFRKRSPA